MSGIFKLVGRLAGIAGVLLALFAVFVRLGGAYVYGGFQVGTLFVAATFVMTLSAACYAASVAERPGR